MSSQSIGPGAHVPGPRRPFRAARRTERAAALQHAELDQQRLPVTREDAQSLERVDRVDAAGGVGDRDRDVVRLRWRSARWAPASASVVGIVGVEVVRRARRGRRRARRGRRRAGRCRRRAGGSRHRIGRRRRLGGPQLRLAERIAACALEPRVVGVELTLTAGTSIPAGAAGLDCGSCASGGPVEEVESSIGTAISATSKRQRDRP